MSIEGDIHIRMRKEIYLKWGLGQTCPKCRSKTTWEPNLMDGDAKKSFEVGQYVCTKCGAKSGIMETDIEVYYK